MPTVEHPRDEFPLRIMAPALYAHLLRVLERRGLHPYDMEATASQHEDSLNVSLRFGKAYAQSVHATVPVTETEAPTEETIRYIQEAVTRCEKQLIADYFKMSKP